MVYRLWLSPFAATKLEPVRRHNDLGGVRRVLDVGCGPGTDTRYFPHAEYIGVDYNLRYLDYARRRYGKHFVVADVAGGVPLRAAAFDFVLVNSFFHHLDAAASRRVLSDLQALLSDDGHVHILDLVMPQVRSVARALARWDRGQFARRLDEWQGLFSEFFEPVLIEPYAVTAAGVAIWNMVYFKGRRRT